MDSLLTPDDLKLIQEIVNGQPEAVVRVSLVHSPVKITPTLPKDTHYFLFNKGPLICLRLVYFGMSSCQRHDVKVMLDLSLVLRAKIVTCSYELIVFSPYCD